MDDAATAGIRAFRPNHGARRSIPARVLRNLEQTECVIDEEERRRDEDAARLGINIAWLISLFRVARAMVLAGGLAAIGAMLYRKS